MARRAQFPAHVRCAAHASHCGVRLALAHFAVFCFGAVFSAVCIVVILGVVVIACVLLLVSCLVFQIA